MTISHLQIAVFLNSHPGSAFGRPVVMAGLRPAMTTGGLENTHVTLNFHIGMFIIIRILISFLDVLFVGEVLAHQLCKI